MKKLENKKGSVYVTILFVLMAISIITTALIQRSLISIYFSKTTSESEKVFNLASRYAENLLFSIKTLDILHDEFDFSEDDGKLNGSRAMLSEINMYDFCNCSQNNSCHYEQQWDEFTYYARPGAHCENSVNCRVSLPTTSVTEFFYDLDNNQIPDSSLSLNWCQEGKFKFFKKDGSEITRAQFKDTSFTEIARIKATASSDDGNLSRSIEIDVPERLPTPMIFGEPQICGIETECPADYLAVCGDKCYKVVFFYPHEYKKKIAAIRFILTRSEADFDLRKIDLREIVNFYQMPDGNYSEEQLQFYKITCDTDEASPFCHFYIGKKNLNEQNFSNNTSNVAHINYDLGYVSFRLASHSSYFLDSLDMPIRKADGSGPFEFDIQL